MSEATERSVAGTAVEGPGEALVGALDQGTTGTRFLLFDEGGRTVASAYRIHEQHYPEPGWVEHDPEEIWENTKRVILDALATAGVDAESLDAIGVANQRETTVLWDAATGEPVHDAIVWQDRRASNRVEELEASGQAGWIRERTGLQPEEYFSAPKLEWLFENAGEGGTPDGRDLRERAADGDLCFGTIDAWLVSRLTGVHATDVTNASRTMLFDVEALAWDDDLLAEFGVPAGCLPEVRPSADPAGYGHTDPDGFLGARVPVTGVLGDQQAALFGQTCFDPGDAKNTYGTGSFLLMNTGTEPVRSDQGLLTTVAFQRAGEAATYALEGSIFVTGAAIEWLVDVGLIDDPADTARLARSVAATDDVFVVPAFSGLGAPYWDGRARGTIVGLTRGTRREHVVRATLEAIGFRTRDVVAAMEADAARAGDADVDVGPLRVDGGSVDNDALCRIQADVLGTEIVRPAVSETTALGAAYAAGLAAGVWDSTDDLREQWRVDARFRPEMASSRADALYERWGEAVERSRDWARDG
jgi:glycerol kinase